jgi:hypothetical protein
MMRREMDVTDRVGASRFVVTLGLCLVIIGLSLGVSLDETGHAFVLLVREAAAQATSGTEPGSQSPAHPTSPTRGMGKEAVRDLWGNPAEVRKIRTCFGWQEAWVYRGDQQRYGADERTLLFDEGELLSDIK